ncbi:MAG: SMC family ATPase [Dehalococcoidia bacterium]|nr:SMC family ATPase [Dehalococcoidia bacterium]
MRPLRLELEGFTSYRERVEIDFDELDLFVICGPTGSGKSSLVDAIAYALYGRVPRVGSEIKACIAQGLDRMWVALEFAVGNERYRVFRSTSHRGQSTVQLERQRDGAWGGLEGKAQAVNECVKELVGLDYDAFTRSVLLPQGQFQVFLAGEPEQRRRVLHELLRLDIYARISTRAGQIATVARSRAEDIARRLQEDYAEATPEALKGKRRMQRELTSQLRGLQEDLDQATEGRRLAERLADARREEVSRRDELRKAGESYEGASQLVEKGEEELSNIKDQLAAVQEALDANPFDPSLLASLKVALAAARDLRRLDESLTRLAEEETEMHSQLALAGETSAQAQGEQAAAEGETRLARQELERLRRQYAADYLRRDLRPGDSCPVCLQTIGKVPPEVHPPLDRADARLKQAERTEKEARAAATKADKGLSVLRQSLAGLQRQADIARQERDRKEAELAQHLPAGQDGSVPALEAAAGHQESAQDEQKRLQGDHQRLEADLRQKEQAVNEARQQLAGLEARAQAAAEALKKAEAEVARLSKELLDRAQARGWAEVCDRLAEGQDPLPAVAALVQSSRQACDNAAAELAVLQERVAQLERDIERAKELREEERARRQEAAVARELADLLRADRFQAFVQEEALRVLAEDGTRHLEELSGGRYAFDVEGQDFLVVDHWNADAARSVKTLSGGETFLASLALALALAERLPGLAGAQGQVTLESLFLDEGFGTLDAETLEVVAQALEALRSGNRMVCLITHVRELAERMPVRIEVVKTQTGSHIAVS